MNDSRELQIWLSSYSQSTQLPKIYKVTNKVKKTDCITEKLHLKVLVLPYLGAHYILFFLH